MNMESSIPSKDHLIGQKISFENSGSTMPDREYVITASDLIAEGYGGRIFRITVETNRALTGKNHNKKGQPIVRHFVLKEFSAHLYGTPENATLHSVQMFEKLKSANITTWSTYRKVANKPMVVMTEGELYGSLLLTQNTTSKSAYAVAEMGELSIDNLSPTLKIIQREATSAAALGIYLHWDSWMVEVAPISHGVCNISAFVGDFDMLTSTEDPTDAQISALKTKNVQMAKKGISRVFVNIEMTRSVRESYEKLIARYLP